MSNETHYVPILRWKQTERLALRELNEEDRCGITPLIELTPTIFKDRQSGGIPLTPEPARVLDEEAKKLLETCKYFPFFLDAHFVDRQIQGPRGKTHALEYLATLARGYKLVLVPVTGLSRRKGYQSAVSRVAKGDSRGVCMRITPLEALRPGFLGEIRDTLKNLDLSPKSVHLLLDYEANDTEVPEFESVLIRIPYRDEWQTLSVASGAFPPDLQQFQKGNSRHPRKDWLTWKRLISDGKKIGRRPGFSDYTIQYGLYKEPVEHCNPSVSLRYTLEEDWLIMRGEAPHGKSGSKRGERRPGREQWNGHAQILCDDPKLFYGQDFSWGDDFIFQRSLNTEDHGSPEIWLRAGINHHMTVVSRQIANLVAP